MRLLPDAFACCFCENADLLGQWRGYDGAGQNVTIEFDTRQLDRLLTNQNGRIVKVIYGRDETRRMLQERLDHNKTSLAWARDPFKSEIDKKRESWTNLVLILTPQFKHKSFEDEREWRVIVQKPSDGNWIGPGKDLKLTKRSVENFLKSFNTYKNVPVEESHVPFRA